MGAKLKKIEKKIEEGIDSKILLFKVFEEPRPKYIAKVTIIDKIIDKLFLWAFPQSVNPNQITVFRFISIPFIVVLLLLDHYKIAFILSIFSAFSDAIDGAIARTRNKITDWGIVFDPFADKLLIGSVGGILIYKFLSPAIALTIIFLELVLIVSAYYRFKGDIVPAKTVGKLKMILQCWGVAFIFIFLWVGNPFFLVLATYTLYSAIICAILSILVYKSI
jgi:CDP-diacylglycerol--glycerol-3-phosphate 3-phosphatidyltransferase